MNAPQVSTGLSTPSAGAGTAGAERALRGEPALGQGSTGDIVTIETTRERAEVLFLSVAHHAVGVSSWAALDGEEGERARRILGRVEDAKADVIRALRASHGGA